MTNYKKWNISKNVSNYSSYRVLVLLYIKYSNKSYSCRQVSWGSSARISVEQKKFQTDKKKGSWPNWREVVVVAQWECNILSLQYSTYLENFLHIFILKAFELWRHATRNFKLNFWSVECWVH
jgi:hypothetical protein